MEARTLSQEVDKFSGRYATYLNALLGVLTTIIDGPTPTSERARQAYNMRSLAMFRNALEAESGLIRYVFTQVKSRAIYNAIEDLGLDSAESVESDLLSQFIEEQSHEAIELLRAQMLRETRTGRQYLRDFAMEVSLRVNGAGQREAAALIAVKKDMGPLSFTHMDRRGYRWKSQRYIETMFKSYLFAIYNESYIYALARHGVNEAVAYHDDPNHRNNGLRFSFAQREDGLPFYKDIRKDVFHPNANLIVAYR